MHEKPNVRSARRRAAIAAVCTAFVAVVGAMLATPANASTLTSGACATSSLVSTDSSGVVELTPDALSGILLNCGVIATTGSTTSTTTPTTTPTIPSTPDSSAVTDPIPSTPTTGASPNMPVITTPTPTAITAKATAIAEATTQISTIQVERSSDAVYPVKDGYLDSVRFAIRALNAAGDFIPVQGTAVLWKSGTAVQSWDLNGATTLLTWDGRVKDKIRTGVYTLIVNAWSPDGSRKTISNKIQVLSTYLQRQALMVRSTIGTTGETAMMPKQLLKAFAKGPVTMKLRTVAKVTGPAKLVFSNNVVTRTLKLRNGVHTTKALPAPMGLQRVTITHKWAKGAAKLKSVEAIWIYYKLN